MKRFFVLMLMMVATVAVAQPPYLFDANNEIGMFMVETPTAESAQDDACYMGGPGQLTAYVVLTSPYSEFLGAPIDAVGGFEFRLEPGIAGLFVTPTIHPSATNFMTPPDYFCGANVPVTGGQCTLITVTIGTFTTDPAPWFLTPISDAAAQSIPGGIAITDANDAFRLQQAYPTTGGGADGMGEFDVPVFAMFDCLDVVPNEDHTWGDVKTMFQ